MSQSRQQRGLRYLIPGIGCLAGLLAGLLVPALADSSASREREERPRFKGTEFYSWKDPGGEWVFKLMLGTNRLKIEAEVKNGEGYSGNVEDLREAFARLAVGENVFWSHLIEGFEYPPDATVRQVEAAAREAEIVLHVPRRTNEPSDAEE